ncbi:MAG TPA: ABC transporter ATP-binding protein [Trebonia sp.]|jgi:branched-chain amino acid transport system ATP-binding protein
MLELHNIDGGYGGTTVLRDVSLSIPAGSVVALLGPNGAGKSTTMRMASGLLRPRSGRVVLDGGDVTAAGPSRRARSGICHIMEGRSIFPSLSVRENLLLQSPRGSSAAEVLERADQEFPQLTKRRKQLAGTLSGGEQQMLALMRAYLARPRVVLVDEASLGLAPVIVDHIFAFLERIATEGVSLLIVEQYANRVLSIASAVYLLSQGRIVYSGPAGELDEDQIFALYAQQSPRRPG